MKKAVTLIEMMIALIVAGVLFAALSRISIISFNSSMKSMKSQLQLNRDLQQILYYENSILSHRETTLNLKIEIQNQTPHYTEFISKAGYPGVVINE